MACSGSGAAEQCEDFRSAFAISEGANHSGAMGHPTTFDALRWEIQGLESKFLESVCAHHERTPPEIASKEHLLLPTNTSQERIFGINSMARAW